MYIPPDLLKSNYPQYGELGKGTYGKVYSTIGPDGKNYAVKVSTSTDAESTSSVLSYFLRELDIYSRLKHKHICKLHTWSIEIHTDDSAELYLVLELGKSINMAKTNGDITYRDVARGILAGIDFLNDNSVAHNDIKPANTVVVDGVVKLIDFGVAEITHPYDNAKVLTTSIYTDHYRDPQTIIYGNGTDKAETYAIGATIYTALTGKYYPGKPSGHAELDPLIEDLVKFPVSQRLSLKDIMAKHNVPTVSGDALETSPLPIKSSTIFNVISGWVLDVFAAKRLHVRSLFMTLHLFHRVFSVLYTGDKDKVQLIATACMYIGLVATSNGSFTIEYLTKISPYSYESILETIIEVVKAGHDIIFTYTYWDYATDVHNLIDLFVLMHSYTYSEYFPGVPEKGKQYSHVTLNSKNIAADYFRKLLLDNKLLELVSNVSTYINLDATITELLAYERVAPQLTPIHKDYTIKLPIDIVATFIC